MSTYILGIDPGLTGALAFYDPLSGDLTVEDMPVFSEKRNGKNKSCLDLYQLARIVDDKASQVKKAVVELVGAMPKQGVSSSFSFGFSAGAAQTVVAANLIPMLTVPPTVWKKALKLNASKDGSRIMASKLMPRHAHLWALKKHDGRAEAALLAYYGEMVG
jgi:crossover junction endodeoxyribonuclease RuvC